MLHLRALSICTVLLITGCTQLSTLTPLTDPGWRAPLQDSKSVATRTVKGKMSFVCTYDGQGFFWRFIQPSGTLYQGTRKTGTLNPDWSITAPSGVTLKAQIITNGPSRGQHLRDALFKTQPHTRGPFANIRYIERTDAQGGMPLTKCSASQQGQHLHRPFTAKYTFWR